jgi:hypothetical protein
MVCKVSYKVQNKPVGISAVAKTLLANTNYLDGFETNIVADATQDMDSLQLVCPALTSWC